MAHFAALGGFAIATAIYVWFNEIRFGTVTDISLWLFTSRDDWLQKRMGGGPPLQLRFLPMNLYALLFMAPVLNERFPYIHPQIQGQALLLTSPAFLLALRPNFRRAIPLLLLPAAAFSMGAVLLWYGNGFMQFGMRFYVQAFPFLMVLMALGAQELGIDQMGKILIVIFDDPSCLWHLAHQKPLGSYRLIRTWRSVGAARASGRQVERNWRRRSTLWHPFASVVCHDDQFPAWLLLLSTVIWWPFGLLFF